MDVRLETTAADCKQLQRCINDLVSILAVPAMWIGDEPSRIVAGLEDQAPGNRQIQIQVEVSISSVIGIFF